MHKEIREIVKLLEGNGYSVVHGGKHLKVKNATGGTVATLPTSPGGGRWKQNLLADLKKKGLI